jgi:hypothetical protein
MASSPTTLLAGSSGEVCSNDRPFALCLDPRRRLYSLWEVATRVRTNLEMHTLNESGSLGQHRDELVRGRLIRQLRAHLTQRRFRRTR